MDSDPIYEIAFASLRLPLPEAALFLQRMGSEKDCMELPASRFPADVKLPESISSLENRLKLVEQAHIELDFIQEHGIKTIYFTDTDYPQKLLQYSEAPLMLYSLGNCDINNHHIISIVGTRHATVYGTEMVNRLVHDLKQLMAEPFIIVSGLAFGIDIAAHKTALDNDIPTIAVLAGGLNSLYPPQHRQTAIKMVEHGGMLMTDYRSQDQVFKGNFLARNRIVAAMSDCVIIAESGHHGGALHTARLAFENNREVFAIPGRLTDTYSEGCNNLIASERARICTSASEVIKIMGWPQRDAKDPQPVIPGLELSPIESAIIKIIELRGEATETELKEILEISQKDLSAKLIEMEFRQLITAIPGGRYRTAH